MPVETFMERQTRSAFQKHPGCLLRCGDFVYNLPSPTKTSQTQLEGTCGCIQVVSEVSTCGLCICGYSYSEMLIPQIRMTHCLPTHLELLPTCLGIFLWYNMYIYHGLLYFGIKLEILKEVQQDSTCFGCRRSQVQFLVSLKEYSDLKPWRASAV